MLLCFADGIQKKLPSFLGISPRFDGYAGSFFRNEDISPYSCTAPVVVLKSNNISGGLTLTSNSSVLLLDVVFPVLFSIRQPCAKTVLCGFLAEICDVCADSLTRRDVPPVGSCLAVHCDPSARDVRAALRPHCIVPPLSTLALSKLASRVLGARSRPALQVWSAGPRLAVFCALLHARAASWARCDVTPLSMPALFKLAFLAPDAPEPALLFQPGLPGHASPCSATSSACDVRAA